MSSSTLHNSITTFDLLRHGEVEAGDIFGGGIDSLSDAGWQNMQDTLQDRQGWDVIVSSTAYCCSEFAESLAEEETLKLVLNEQLLEIHFGEWEGCSPDDILQKDEAALHAWWQSPTKVTPPRGEDYNDFRARVLKAFKSITQNYENQHVLLITHASVIRVILMYILGIQDENLFRLHLRYANFSRIEIYHDQTGEWGALIEHG